MTYVDEALSENEDAIGIGRKGTIDRPYKLHAPFWTVDTLFYAVPKANINIEFALSCFLRINWKAKDESTGLPSLSKNAISDTQLLIPVACEQAQIGAFFRSLDHLITLHQRKRFAAFFRQRECWWVAHYRREAKDRMTRSTSWFSSSRMTCK